MWKSLLSIFSVCLHFVIFLSRGQLWDLLLVTVADEVKRSYFAARSTLLLHYISSSGCTVAFCPRLVRWQEAAVGGWYLPQTVTCSQSDPRFQEIYRKKEHVGEKKEAFTPKDGNSCGCYQQLFVAGEKPAGFLHFIWWTDVWAQWGCCRLESDKSPRLDWPNHSRCFLTTGSQNVSRSCCLDAAW